MLRTKLESEKETVQQETFAICARRFHSVGIFNIWRYGGMSRECSTFYNRLSNLLSEKKDILPSVTINWIQQKFQSCFLCLRGTRSLDRNIATVGDDVQFSCEVSKIP